jgi:hypothetical protein
MVCLFWEPTNQLSNPLHARTSQRSVINQLTGRFEMPLGEQPCLSSSMICSRTNLLAMNSHAPGDIPVPNVDILDLD